MKKIAKDKLNPELEAIVAQHATDVAKGGAQAKSYTFTDMPGLLHHCEQLVREMNIPDFDLKIKMQTNHLVQSSTFIRKITVLSHIRCCHVNLLTQAPFAFKLAMLNASSLTVPQL